MRPLTRLQKQDALVVMVPLPLLAFFGWQPAAMSLASVFAWLVLFGGATAPRAGHLPEARPGKSSDV